MTLAIRITDISGVRDDALLAYLNEITAALGQAGLVQHHAARDIISTVDATTGPTLIALANVCRAAHIAHIADTDAHVAADATNTVTAPVATTAGEARTLINELKIDINAHIILAAAHRGVPFAAPITTADGSDDATDYALCNVLKAVLSRHFAGISTRSFITA